MFWMFSLVLIQFLVSTQLYFAIFLGIRDSALPKTSNISYSKYSTLQPLSFYMFCDFVHLKLVGTATYNLQKVLADIILALPSLRYKSRQFSLDWTTCSVVLPNFSSFFTQRYDIVF